MSRAEIEKLVKRRQSNERNEQKTDEASERQQKKLTGDAKKVKKSIRKIERRTRGRDTVIGLNATLGDAGDNVLRRCNAMQNVKAMNDKQWRIAA